MAIIETKINTHSPDFQANAEQTRGQVNALDTLLAHIAKAGGDKAVARHKARG